MHWQDAPYVVPLVIAAAIAATLARLVWQRRPVAGAAPLAWLLLAVTIWSLGYALELAGDALPAKVWWARIQYLGIVNVPAAWLVFALEYTGRGRWLTRRSLVLLALLPLITLFLVWTNEAHGLIWSTVALEPGATGYPMLKLTHGLWFWVYAAYSYLLLFLGTLLLLRVLVRFPHLYREQSGVLLTSALLPWLANAVYLARLSPLPHLDLTPFAFTVSGALLALGLYRYRLLDIVPVARDAVIESLRDGVVALDVQGRIVDLNAAAQRIIGVTASEAVGWPAKQVVPAWQDRAAGGPDGKPAPPEIVLGDGDEPRFYEPQLSPLYDRHGRLTGRLLVLHDISERKRAEEERAQRVREQAARAAAEQTTDRIRRLQAVTAALSEALTPVQVAEVVVVQGVGALNAAAGSMALLSGDGTELGVVQAVGYSPEVLETYRSFPLTAPIPLADAVRTGELVVLDSPEARAARYPHLATAHPAPDRCAWVAIPLLLEGRALGAMGLSFATARDFSVADRAFMITLGRQCAQALERARLYEAEQQARAVAEAAQQRGALLAEASKLLAASLDYETTLTTVVQLPVPELADLCIIDLLGEDGAIQRAAVAHRDTEKEELVREASRRYASSFDERHPVWRVVQTGEPELHPVIDEALVATVAQDGEYAATIRGFHPRSAVFVPLTTRGRTIGVLTFVSREPNRYGPDDLALVEELGRRAALAIDNARLYREAQEAIHARDVFLSLASHELKTPLTVLQGHAELFLRRMQREDSADQRDRRSVRSIYEQAVRLHKLIELLLDLSRLQGGQLSIEREPVDLGALARQLIDTIQPTLERHTVELHCSNEPLVVEGDELRLGQVLQNLISNAIKYSPAGGQITVRLERCDDQARLIVADQGHGVPAAVLPQIFGQFYRAPHIDPRRVSGLGLGLAVVKEVVTLHGGTVEVSSREGEGSTFTVSLPLFGG